MSIDTGNLDLTFVTMQLKRQAADLMNTWVKLASNEQCPLAIQMMAEAHVSRVASLLEDLKKLELALTE